MTRSEDLERLIVAAHALTRIAALETRSEAPAAQWRTLSILRESGPLRIGELATRSRVTQPGMTRLAGAMVDAGLLARTSDDSDSRASVIRPTPAGLDALDRWLAQLTDALTPHFADLDDSEWQALHVTADVLARKTRAVEVAR
jgi:DNA-binding MarR family transcriptional regulator